MSGAHCRTCWRYRGFAARSEEHTSELQSLMRNSYAVFCLKKKKPIKETTYEHTAHKIIITENKQTSYRLASVNTNIETCTHKQQIRISYNTIDKRYII